MECVRTSDKVTCLQHDKPAVRAQISLVVALGCDQSEALAAGNGAVSCSAPAGTEADMHADRWMHILERRMSASWDLFDPQARHIKWFANK